MKSERRVSAKVVLLTAKISIPNQQEKNTKVKIQMKKNAD
jgi:hypothetical protein